MANKKNLILFEGERARELGRKGGKASGKARRKRHTLKECMEKVLSLPVPEGADYDKLTAMGIDAEKVDNSMLVAVGLFDNAKTGNVPAYKELTNLIDSEQTENGTSVEVSKLYRALEGEDCN